MQEAVGNHHNLPLEDLLESCRQQKASDEMLLFVRAICAAGLLLEPVDSLVQLMTMLEEAQVHCRFVLVIVIMDMICLKLDANCHALELFQCLLIWICPPNFAELFAQRSQSSGVFAGHGIWRSALRFVFSLWGAGTG